MQRRRFIAATAALGMAPLARATSPAGPLSRAIPASGEMLPVVGMGSWITFNVGADEALRAARLEVLRAFFAAGGRLVDSSPMYGSSEEVLGWCLQRLDGSDDLFAATKVWTPLAWHGTRQMEASERLWGRRMDLQQVHNLVALDSHMPTLLEWKAAGRIRYVGVTTSHGSRHDEIEQAMRDHPLDFVQFTYNLVDRDVERRLLPLAADRGIAVIVNRPFRRGALLQRLARHPLPGWAAGFDCANWAQFCLKFIVSHPAVTCAIPATSRVDHMRQNMGATRGALPDAAMRERMLAHVRDL